MIKEGQTIMTNYTGERYRLTGVDTVTTGVKKKAKKRLYTFAPVENTVHHFTQTEEEFNRLVARKIFTIEGL